MGQHQSIHLRDARAEDIPSVAPWLDDPSNPLWRADDLLRAIKSPGYTLLVAIDAASDVAIDVASDQQKLEQVCAFALLRSVQLSEAETEWSLLYLLVAPFARRRGVGAQLLRGLQGRISAQPAASLQLEVRPGNTAARALYSACGFVEQGRRPRYYEPTEPGGQREDALLLAWPGADSTISNG